MKKKKFSPMFWISFIFIFIGLIFAGVGVGSFILDKQFKAIAKETKATITDIFTSRDSDGDANHDVYVTFSVRDREYEGRLNYYSSSMRVGKTVDILYDPDDPYNFRSGSTSLFIYIFTPIGLLFFGIGLVFSIKQRGRNALKKHLITHGTKIMAHFNEIVPGNVTVNGRPCYHIICQYKDDSTGNLYVFKSEGVWTSIPYSNSEVPNVPVYVDYNDYTKYHVDVDGYLERVAGVNQVVDLT